MTSDWRRVKELFLAVLDLPDAPTRQAFVERESGGDIELRQQLEGLLRAHEEPASALNQLLAAVGPSDVTREYTPQPDVASDQSTIPDSAADLEAGTIIAGRYTLVEKIGEGGMGEVWIASQAEPIKRRVALKLIKPGMDSRAVLHRFEQERQALALMNHPHIARVLDGGLTGDRQPFFVMELVNGLPLTKFCDEARLSTRERLELFVLLCQAVQHAHQKGIVHRDLKPSNILVTRIDDQPIPKIIDFGVAKAMGGKLTNETLSTQWGSMIGTLEYMSPEQAGFSGIDIDTRTDIYSLGVILYELLTGLKPFDGQRLRQMDLTELLRILKEEEPCRPSARLAMDKELASRAALRQTEPKRLLTLLRGELDWVVMKCLEKQRERRYETVGALARDIQRYLADEPVQACPPSALYRFGKFARRNKRALVSLSVFVLAGLVALSSLAVSNAQISEEAREKTKALEAAKRERDNARRNLYVAHMNLAQMHWENANVSQVEKLLDLYRRVEPGQEDLRGWEWYYQERLCRAYLRTLRGHESSVLSLAFSPDGSRLVTGGNDPMVRVWDVATGRERRTFPGNKDRTILLAFSPDGTRVAIGGADNTVKLWDVASGKELRTFRGKKHVIHQVFSLAFSADGKRLVAGTDSPGATVWDVTSGEELCRLPRGVSVAFSPDGTQVATTEATVHASVLRAGAGAGFDVTLWDVKSGRAVRTFRGHPARVTSVAFSPDGLLLASCGFDNTVKVWDVASGQELRTLQGHKAWVTAVAFSPDGGCLASGSHDQTVKVWDVDSGQELRTYRGHNDSVTTVAFSPDGTRLASGSADTKVMLWEVARDQECRTLHTKLSATTSLAFSPDGTRLASGSYKSVLIADVASGKVLRTLPGGASTVAFSPDGKRLATGGSGDRSIRLWDVASGKELQILQRPILAVQTEVQINTLAFSPDGTRLASGSHHGAVKLWDVASGQELRTLQGENMVWGVAFSPDGTRLACNDGRTIKVWDVASGKEFCTLRGHKDQVVGVAFSPDGTRIASSSNDRTVKVWDVASGQELRTLDGHKGSVGHVAFSPDGRRIASASIDYTVKVWDVASGQELRTLRHESLVGPVAFSPDGMRLATGSGGTVRLWDATPLTAARRVEQEARARLDLLFGKPLIKADVVTRLRDDPTISEAVRRQALDLVEHYAPNAHRP